ncbi:hypothetical protein [Flavobacterium sp.]|jgi:hypothetical protein|uniref:hypothetical protein n=1 Tax=Flavobacterium sp. TaxID=239 RepID=UPI0037C186F2
MHRILFLFVILLFVSCQSKENKAADKEACPADSKTNDDGFKMYQMSEMAVLMEQMYVDNQRLKDRIIKGDTIGKFPQHFERIHQAIMTDGKDRDAFFEDQAQKFIIAQEQIYKDPKNAKAHFNKGVDACIQCHQQKCGGPIPKIKKLYIK